MRDETKDALIKRNTSETQIVRIEGLDDRETNKWLVRSPVVRSDDDILYVRSVCLSVQITSGDHRLGPHFLRSVITCPIPTRIQTIIHSRYLRVPVPLALCTVIRIYARTISVRSRDKYSTQRSPRIPPRRWNAIFARGLSLSPSLANLEFASSRPQPPDCNPSPAFVTRETHPQLFIAFTLMILVGSHAPMLHTRSNLAFVH